MTCVDIEKTELKKTETFNLKEEETKSLYQAVIGTLPEIKEYEGFCIIGPSGTYFGTAHTVNEAISIMMKKGLNSDSFIFSESNKCIQDLYEIINQLPISQGVVSRPWFRTCPIFFYKCKNKDDILYLLFPC